MRACFIQDWNGGTSHEGVAGGFTPSSIPDPTRHSTVQNRGNCSTKISHNFLRHVHLYSVIVEEIESVMMANPRSATQEIFLISCVLASAAGAVRCSEVCVIASFHHGDWKLRLLREQCVDVIRGPFATFRLFVHGDVLNAGSGDFALIGQCSRRKTRRRRCQEKAYLLDPIRCPFRPKPIIACHSRPCLPRAR